MIVDFDYLNNIISDNKTVTVRWKKDSECNSTDEGWLGEMIEVWQEDDYFCCKVNIEPYYEKNKEIAKHNYFDADGNPTLTAEEAGLYPKNHIVCEYFNFKNGSLDGDIELVIDNSEITLYNAYKSANDGETFYQWLIKMASKSLNGKGEQ